MSAIRLSIIRRLSMAILLSMVLTLLSGASRAVPSAEAAQPAAVSGVVLVVGQTGSNTSTPKTVSAICPNGKRVIGGGGSAEELGDPDGGGGSRNQALTELRPLRFYDGTTTRDAYMVTAAETPPGTTNAWWVTAYAVCADPLPGLNIVSATTTPSSDPMQATAASCGGGVAIGTGASVNTRTGNVVLQVARPSTTGASALAQAHEGAAGYTGNWSVTAYAVCVPTKPAGYQVVKGESTAWESQSSKIGSISCPSGTRLLSSGAAITNIAPGHVSLEGIIPRTNDRRTYVWAVENTSYLPNWDYIVATAVCAY
jgi:hypothetical protein